MLRRLMVKLGAARRRSVRARKGATAPRGDRRVRSAVLPRHGPARGDDSFDRAWRRVGLALDRTGFTVEDRDQLEGIYFVRYIDPEPQSTPRRRTGFLSRWRSGPDGRRRSRAVPHPRGR